MFLGQTYTIFKLAEIAFPVNLHLLFLLSLFCQFSFNSPCFTVLKKIKNSTLIKKMYSSILTSHNYVLYSQSLCKKKSQLNIFFVSSDHNLNLKFFATTEARVPGRSSVAPQKKFPVKRMLMTLLKSFRGPSVIRGNFPSQLPCINA